MHFGIDRRFGVDAWKIIETEYIPTKNAQSQSIFSLANEYMGTRGLFEEGGHNRGEKSYAGCYINGLFVRETYPYVWKRKAMPTEANFIANTTDWLAMTVRVGDELFAMAPGCFEDYERVLDMQTATLARRLVFVTSRGERTALSFERFISYDDQHAAAVRLRLTPLNHSTPIRVHCHLDGRTGNEMFVKHEKAGTAMLSESDGRSLALLKKLPSTGHYFITRGHVLTDFECAVDSHVEDELNPGLQLAFVPTVNKTYTIDKLVATVTSRDCGYPDGLIPKGAMDRSVDPAAEQKIVTFLTDESRLTVLAMARLGYDTLHAAHVEAVRKIWECSDVEIEGDALAQQGIRYGIFQLNSTYRGNDAHLNIAAKGLTSEIYQGRHFWDTESYCLPFYLFTNPAAAKNLVASRYHHLNAARALAREFDYKGAVYPWQTIDGSEDCPIWEYTFGEIHINAIIPYAAYLYTRVTGDTSYLYTQGIEVLLECSRFWADRSDYIPYRGGYAINRVMGPDEYQQMVNNNYYTNYMARSTLQYTLDVIAEMKQAAPDALRAVYDKVAFDESELLVWRKVVDGMLLNVDDRLNIFVQDDMFLSLTPVSREDMDKERDIPVESKWTIVKFQKSQIVKQPDVLLLFFLHPERFTAEQKKNNYRFYEQRTVHGSSLSPSIHSILANEIGRPHQAYEYYLWSSRLDLDDFNGNVHEGLHISAMSGSWLNIVFGFGGMRIRDEGLSFSPSLPPSWRHYTFRITYRGRILQLTIGRDTVSAKVVSGTPLIVSIFGQDVAIESHGSTVTVPHSIAHPATLQGVVFDLDGIITDTAHYHYKAWKTIADEEGIYFDEVINERLKGVSRMESLRILLEKASRAYSPEEKEAMATLKNKRYVDMLESLTPADMLPGIAALLDELRVAGIKTAICSASRNTDKILAKLGIRDRFDAVVTGKDTTHSKPHPEGMILAAQRMQLAPKNCVVIEDAFAGVEAGRTAGMRTIGVGDKLQLHNADTVFRCTEHLRLARLRMVF